MAAQRFNRIGWLLRRLSRIYPAEIPYRIAGVTRATAQSRGWFDARQPPPYASDATFGRAWVRVPNSQHIDQLVFCATAEQILINGIEVFDVVVPLVNGVPDWNRDPKTGVEIAKSFGLSIDFRHIAGGVDIKYLWELNRHVWWVPLAQAYAASGEHRYLHALSILLDSWLTECHYPLGANWSSPVEHGIRLINWSIVWHLIGGAESPMFATPSGVALRDRWMISIYQHIRFASDNYSFHSSADNHLIGEAAGVFVAGHTWDLWKETRVLRARAKQILEAEMLKQFTSDGVNVEQAICYHKFSLEFLLASLLVGAANDDPFSPAFKTRMQMAIEFIAAMMDCDGHVPAIGDSDDGKVFSFVTPAASSAYETMLIAGAALFGSPALLEKQRLLGMTQTAEERWLNIPVTSDAFGIVQPKPVALGTNFKHGGYVIMGRNLHLANEVRLTMDVGPLGSNRIAGHGHADALSLLLSAAGQDFLVDPGTYCYNAAPELRHYFRGTSAHNTVTIDGMDQSIYGGSFLWLRDITTVVHQFSDNGTVAMIEASHDGYTRLTDPVTHTRAITFNRQTLEILVEDRFACSKTHQCEVRWHFGPDCKVTGENLSWAATREVGTFSMDMEAEGFAARVVTGTDDPPAGWYSAHFYEKQATAVLVCGGTIGPLSVVRTRFAFAPRDENFFRGA